MADNINDVLSELLAQDAANQQNPDNEQTNDEANETTSQEAQSAADNQQETQQSQGNAANTDASTAANAAPQAQSANAAPQAQSANAAPQAQSANAVPQAQSANDAAAIGLEKAAAALQQAQAQNAQLSEQLKSIISSQKQQNETAQETIEQEAQNQPNIDIDISELQYLSDEERAERLNKFISGVENRTRESVMKEFQPVMDDYKRRQQSAEDEAVKTTLAGQQQFKGFADNEQSINSIIQRTPELQSLPPEKKYTLAYLINRGVNAMNSEAKPRSIDDIVNEVASNPDAMRMIEAKRAQTINDSNKQIPILSSSNSSGVAPATVDRTPKTLAEALEKSRKMLG